MHFGLIIWIVAILVTWIGCPLLQDEGRRASILREVPLPNEQIQQNKQSARPVRLLYIVTTLEEYNSGKRKTVRGSDRFQETLIPVVTESVQSMTQAGYDVDLFLIADYALRSARITAMRQALPRNVGFEYWDRATPLGVKERSTSLENRTTYLARQHRYVVKDKFAAYDMFVCFEDDMLIHGAHVDHYRAVTAELDRLRKAAPDGADLASPGETSTIRTRQELMHSLPVP